MCSSSMYNAYVSMSKWYDQLCVSGDFWGFLLLLLFFLGYCFETVHACDHYVERAETFYLRVNESSSKQAYNRYMDFTSQYLNYFRLEPQSKFSVHGVMVSEHSFVRLDCICTL